MFPVKQLFKVYWAVHIYKQSFKACNGVVVVNCLLSHGVKQGLYVCITIYQTVRPVFKNYSVLKKVLSDNSSTTNSSPVQGFKTHMLDARQ